MTKAGDAAQRRPLIVCIFVAITLVAFVYIGRSMYPVVVVGDLTDLAPTDLQPPTPLDRLTGVFRSSEGAFGLLSVAFAAIILTVFGWWRGAGFNGRKNWHRPYLALPPLGLAVVALSDGFRVPDGFGEVVAILLTTLLAVFAEEITYRGLLWKALSVYAPLVAALVTSVLSGIFAYIVNVTGGPAPEAVFITTLTLCGSFVYAAISYRVKSIWPVIGVHLLVSLSLAFANLGSATYQLLLTFGTVGFVIYGLALLLIPHRSTGDHGSHA